MYSCFFGPSFQVIPETTGLELMFAVFVWEIVPEKMGGSEDPGLQLEMDWNNLGGETSNIFYFHP